MGKKTGHFYGFVLFILTDKGSKSEHYTPFLVINGETIYELYKEGDNPFSNEVLRPFHLSFCLISGTINIKKKLIVVSDIEKSDDPALRMNVGK